MRTKVYISGPLSSSGDRLENVKNAKAAAVDLICRGYSPLCPHLTHYLDPTDAFGHDAWMEVDLPWVRVSDVVLRLPGVSKGADLEVKEASLYGVPVVYSLAELVSRFTAKRPENMAGPERQPTGDPRFKAVLDELYRQHCKKGADYGTDQDIFANIRASEDFGIPAWLGAIMRGNDKVARIKTYAQKGTLANESVEDAFADLANYAAIALVLFRELQALQEHRAGNSLSTKDWTKELESAAERCMSEVTSDEPEPNRFAAAFKKSAACKGS